MINRENTAIESRRADGSVFIYSPRCGFGGYKVEASEGGTEFYSEELAKLHKYLERLGVKRFYLPRCLDSLEKALRDSRVLRRIIVASGLKFDSVSGKNVNVRDRLRKEVVGGTDVYILKGYEANGDLHLILNPLDSQKTFKITLTELLTSSE